MLGLAKLCHLTAVAAIEDTETEMDVGEGGLDAILRGEELIMHQVQSVTWKTWLIKFEKKINQFCISVSI